MRFSKISFADKGSSWAPYKSIGLTDFPITVKGCNFIDDTQPALLLSDFD